MSPVDSHRTFTLPADANMIHVIIGTRAQLIKMAPVLRALQNREIEYNFIFLAQHKETMAEIMDQFGLKKPDSVIGDLGKDITRIGEMALWSIRVLLHVLRNKRRVFKNDKSGIVLIHGDAPPLLLGGLMAKFQGLKVAQVEAGLRSFNFLQPFPEEITRVLASRLGLIDIFFCQDARARENVKKYYGNREAYCTPFNTMLDALRAARDLEERHPCEIPEGKYAIVTLHRFETISSRGALSRVVESLGDIAKKIPLLFILHPPTRVALKKFGLYERLNSEARIKLLPRLGFFEFNRLFRHCEFIISDGGSNQEESYYLGIPCLLLRNETERQEGLGQNVVLSKFDRRVIGDFVDRYQEYRRGPVPGDVSPTEFILDKLQPFA